MLVFGSVSHHWKACSERVELGHGSPEVVPKWSRLEGSLPALKLSFWRSKVNTSNRRGMGHPMRG